MDVRDIGKVLERVLLGARRETTPAGPVDPVSKSWTWLLKSLVGPVVVHLRLLDTVLFNDITPRLIYTDRIGDVIQVENPNPDLIIDHFLSTFNLSKVCSLDGPLTPEQLISVVPIARGFLDEVKCVFLRLGQVRKALGEEVFGGFVGVQAVRYTCKHKPQTVAIQRIQAKGEGMYTSTLYSLDGDHARPENNLELEEQALASTVEILHAIESNRHSRVLLIECIYLKDEQKKLWLQLCQKCQIAPLPYKHISVLPMQVKESVFSLYSDAQKKLRRGVSLSKADSEPWGKRIKLAAAFKGIPSLHLPKPKRHTQSATSLFTHSHPHFQCVGKHCSIPVSVPALYKPRVVDMYKFQLLNHSAIDEVVRSLRFPLSEKALARELHVRLMADHRALINTREHNRSYLEKRPVQLPEDTVMKVTGILCPTCYRVYSTCAAIQIDQNLLYIQPEALKQHMNESSLKL